MIFKTLAPNYEITKQGIREYILHKLKQLQLPYSTTTTRLPLTIVSDKNTSSSQSSPLGAGRSLPQILRMCIDLHSSSNNLSHLLSKYLQSGIGFHLEHSPCPTFSIIPQLTNRLIYLSAEGTGIPKVSAICRQVWRVNVASSGRALRNYFCREEER